MIIGYTASGEDVDVNVCQDQAPDQHPFFRLRRRSAPDPHQQLSTEGCLEFLAQDELLEVTPENLRIRKQI